MVKLNNDLFILYEINAININVNDVYTGRFLWAETAAAEAAEQAALPRAALPRAAVPPGAAGSAAGEPAILLPPVPAVPHQAEGYPPAAAARDPRAVLTEAVLLTDRGITVHHQRLILRHIPTRHRITAGMTTTILHREATVIPMEEGDTVQAAVSACALRWW